MPTGSSGSSPRFQELDSLRGLAAVSVVIYHLGLRYWWPWTTWLPIRFLYAGHQAVILFFVLSGFVLSLPYHKRRPLPYLVYATKRIARIWLPFVAIVLLAFAWRWGFHQNSVPIYSQFRNHWEAPLNLPLLMSHLGLIVGMNVQGLIPTAWSLIHEMRISLVFPLIMLGLRRWSWPVLLGVAVLTSLGSGLAAVFWKGGSEDNFMPISHTAYYVGMFIVGSVLARHRAELVEWARKLTRSARAGLCFVAYLCYNYGYSEDWSGAKMFLGDWAVTFACAVLIVVALSFGSSLFSHQIPVFLGHISYSLYLVHVPIICGLMLFFVKVAPGAPVYLAFPFLFAASLLGGTAFWYFIERPVVWWCTTIGQRPRLEAAEKDSVPGLVVRPVA